MAKKRGTASYEVISGILSFVRSEYISADLKKLSKAFEQLKTFSLTFSLLKDLTFGQSAISVEVDRAFQLLFSATVIYYPDMLDNQTYALRQDVFKEIRRDLPKHFTAREIVQLSEIAEALEETIAVKK